MIADARALHESLAGGATLPADWYRDPEISRREEERIFSRTWQYAGRTDELDLETLSARPIQVDTWGPLVFVNRDIGAPPLAAALGDLPETIASGGVDIEMLRFRERSEWVIEANWKVAIENYLECYHCPVAHPGFSEVIDVAEDAYRLTAEGLVSSQFGTPRPSALTGNGAPYDPRGPIPQAQYHLLWPNTTLNVEAGQPNLSVDYTRPLGPDRSFGATDYFFGEEVSDELAEQMMEFASQVGREDSSLVESVQRGLSSGMVPQGRLLMSSEHLIHHFQRLVAEALLS